MQLMEALERFQQFQVSSDRSDNTIQSYRNDLLHLAKYVTDKYNCAPYLADITSDDLEDYMYHLNKNLGYTTSSRKRKLAVIRTFFNFCFRKKYCETNPAVYVESIRLEQKERLYLSEDEVKAIVEQIEQPLIKLVVQTLYYTGLRISECLNLQVEDIDFAKSVVKVKKSKGKKERHVPLHPKLKSLLSKYIQHERPYSKTNHFFCTPNSGRLSRSYVNKVMAHAVSELGWDKEINCHSMRHAFASNLVSKNVHIVHVQKLLGHTSLTTTSIYTHARKTDLVNAVNVL